MPLKFFITHSWKDIDFTRKLCDDLHAAGLDGFFDERSVRPGESIPSRIEQGLENCDVYIPVFSPDALKSKWCDWEINMAIMMNREGDRPHIIPVIAEKCTIPTRLRHLLYVNFVGRYDDALNELLTKGFALPPKPRPTVVALPSPLPTVQQAHFLPNWLASTGIAVAVVVMFIAMASFVASSILNGQTPVPLTEVSGGATNVLRMTSTPKLGSDTVASTMTPTIALPLVSEFTPVATVFQTRVPTSMPTVLSTPTNSPTVGPIAKSSSVPSVTSALPPLSPTMVSVVGESQQRLDPVLNKDSYPMYEDRFRKILAQEITNTIAISVTNVINGNQIRLFHRAARSIGTISSAIWLPNKNQLLISHSDYGSIFFDSDREWHFEKITSVLARINADGSGVNEEFLTAQFTKVIGPFASNYISFGEAISSPDGRNLVVWQRTWNGNRCPFIMNSDGMSSRQLPSCEADDHPRFWSVDGKWVITWSDRGLKLYAYEVDGNRRVPLEQLGKIQVYDQRYWPWKVTDSPVCKGPSFWECE